MIWSGLIRALWCILGSTSALAYTALSGVTLDPLVTIIAAGTTMSVLLLLELVFCE